MKSLNIRRTSICLRIILTVQMQVTQAMQATHLTQQTAQKTRIQAVFPTAQTAQKTQRMPQTLKMLQTAATATS
jgi:hypothetical protein